MGSWKAGRKVGGEEEGEGDRGVNVCTLEY